MRSPGAGEVCSRSFPLIQFLSLYVWLRVCHGRKPAFCAAAVTSARAKRNRPAMSRVGAMEAAVYDT